MKCYHCGSDTRVMDTRAQADLAVARRRKCEDPTCARSFVTFEGYAGAVNRKRLRAMADSARARWALRTRDRIIFRELHLGWQSLAARYRLTKTSIYLAARRGAASLKVKT